MFWTTDFLVRKGPLNQMWLAGTMKTLSKRNIAAADIVSLSGHVMYPAEAFALPVSGTLLLGLVVIFDRKTRYLLTDASEILSLVRRGFRPGLAGVGEMDLAPRTAAGKLEAVTLPAHKVAMLERLSLGAPLPPEESALLVDLHVAALPEAEDALRAAEEEITLPGIPLLDGSTLQSMEEQIPRPPAVEELGLDVTLGELEAAGFQRPVEPVPLPEMPFGSPEVLPPVEYPMEMFPEEGALPDLEPEYVAAEVRVVSGAAAAAAAAERRKKRKARPGYLYDKQTELSAAFIKASLRDTSDIVVPRPIVRIPRVDYTALYSGPAISRMCPALREAFDFRPAVPPPKEKAAELELVEEGERAEISAVDLMRAAPAEGAPEADLSIGVGRPSGAMVLPATPSSVSAIPLEEPFELLPEELPARVSRVSGAGVEGLLAGLEEAEEERPAPFVVEEEEEQEREKERVEGARQLELDVQAGRILRFLQSVVSQPGESVVLQDLVQSSSRYVASQLFYQLMVLQTNGFVSLQQSDAYSPIRISLLEPIQGTA